MNATRYTAALSGLVVVLMITALFTPVAYADSHQEDEPAEDEDRTYRIVQGDQQLTVDPIQGDVPVEEFYDYRYSYLPRDDPAWGRSFSSEGTTEYQEDDTSILMLYEGPEGVSLVAVHDRYHENRNDGTDGGSVSWEITGLPENGEWAVIDDDYGWRNESETHDDVHQLDPDHRTGAAGSNGEPPPGVDARLSWVWTDGRADGMAYRGLGQDDVSITIDPAFNENSYHRYGDQRRPDVEPDDPEDEAGYNGTVGEWQVITATDDSEEFRRISLDSLEDDVVVEHAPESEPESESGSGSESPAPTAALSGPEQAVVGEAVTFSTSGTTGEIKRYEWTVDGDPVESADGSTLTQTFDEPTTAEVEVTVTAADDQTDTASKTVEIVESDGIAGREQTPGFGVGATIAALGAVILLTVRRGET